MHKRNCHIEHHQLNGVNKMRKEYIRINKHHRHVLVGSSWLMEQASIGKEHCGAEEDRMIDLIDKGPFYEEESSSDDICWIEFIYKILDEKEAFVIEEYIWNSKTFEEIGNALGVTRQRAHQIFHSSLEKMKNHFESKGV